jgi:hypothetical protein
VDQKSGHHRGIFNFPFCTKSGEERALPRVLGYSCREGSTVDGKQGVRSGFAFNSWRLSAALHHQLGIKHARLSKIYLAVMFPPGVNA